MIRQLVCLESFDTDPYRNLAVERYLTLRAGPEACTLFLWQNADTVVIGRNQNAWKECRISLLEAEGGRLARRLSGGGAVFHDVGNLNFSFIVRREDYDVPRQLSVIAAACRSLGIAAVVTGRNDLTAAGRKFSGNAFFETREGCCHHGTILIAADTDRMGRYLNVSREKLEAHSVASVRARVGNLAALSPGLTPDVMRTALRDAFAAVCGLPVTTPDPETLDRREIRELTAFFADPEWRYGRCADFTHRFSRRFDWGEAELCLTVERGIVTDCVVWSDALDPSFCPAAADALRGLPPAAEPLCAALAGCVTDPVCADLSALIRDSL